MISSDIVRLQLSYANESNARPTPRTILVLPIFHGGSEQNGNVGRHPANKLTGVRLGSTLKREQAIGNVIVVMTDGGAHDVPVI